MFRIVGTFKDGSAYRFQRDFHKRESALRLYGWHIKTWRRLHPIKKLACVCASTGRTLRQWPKLKRKRKKVMVFYLAVKPSLYQTISKGYTNGERVMELLRANMMEDTIQTLDRIAGDDTASLCLVESPQIVEGMVPKFLPDNEIGQGQKIHLF